MAAPKKTSTSRRSTATPKNTGTTKAAPKAPKPTAMATRVKPVRTVPVQAAPHAKTLANGEPRPKSRRGK